MAKSRPLIQFIVSCFFAYLAVIVFAWNQRLSLPEALAPSFLRESPEASMLGATSRFLQNRGDPEVVELDRLMRGVRSGVLEDEPFTFLAAQQFETEETAELENLLQVAVRRNPRSREARVYLLELLVNERRAKEAIEQIEVLTRLMPDRQGLFQSNLLFLITSPDTRSEALASISDQKLKISSLRSLARAGASPSMVLDTYNKLGVVDLGPDPNAQVSGWVRPFIERQNYEGAKRVWQNFNPAPPKDSFIIDHGFSGEFGPPFGWTLRSGKDGYARFSEKGLIGEHFGRRKMQLAQQLLLLDPGTYSVELDRLSDAGALELNLACSQGEILLNSLVDADPLLEFQVPETNCEVQSISIIGRPSEPPRTTNFQVGRITIEKVGI